jgi:hypothetical protein
MGYSKGIEDVVVGFWGKAPPQVRLEPFTKTGLWSPNSQAPGGLDVVPGECALELSRVTTRG